MGKPKTKKTKEHPYVPVVLDALLSVALVGAIGCIGWRVAAGGDTINQTSTYSDIAGTDEITSPTEEATEVPAIIYQNEEYINLDVYNGPLTLVNADEPFRGTGDFLVSLYETKLAAESHSFSVRDAELQLRQEAADNIITMLDDFFEATYDDNILVLTGYRSKERQQELYEANLAESEDDEEASSVAKGGYSEHQTGYGVDLSLLGEDDYDGTGIYAWINEHCHEYGYVLRYTEAKESITQVTPEPWHYRYVGKPHAYYMTTNRLCMEEYIDLLREHPYEGEHLSVTDEDGTVYEIYFVEASTSFATTMVPVPGKLSYEVSGNNSDGFIVTVNTGEKDASAAKPTASESTEATEETTESTEE